MLDGAQMTEFWCFGGDTNKSERSTKPDKSHQSRKFCGPRFPCFCAFYWVPTLGFRMGYEFGGVGRTDLVLQRSHHVRKEGPRGR